MRMLAALRTPTTLAALGALNLLLLWLIVPSGAIVRLTASGLGCPDWPLCGGEVVPATGLHSVIEYTNRLLSGVVVIVAVLTALAAWATPGAARAIRGWTLAAALASVGQAPLGAITVLSGLHPLAVGSHFLLSMVALACGTLAWLHIRDRRAGRRRLWDARRGTLAGLVLAGAITVLTTGVIVTAAGPHPGDADVVRRWGHLTELASIHVRSAFAFVAVATVMVVWLWREGGLDRLTARLTGAALVLFALQITLGEIQYRNGLPWQVVAAHVSVAGLLWAVMVALCWGIIRPATRDGV
ncbi:MAG TPA: COX15/CtaA family protein, partial [Miltoncostaeaceae bacterium]|nr:COX15/CtaA family protein [Miltoncostaeaceae bacterium]